MNIKRWFLGLLSLVLLLTVLPVVFADEPVDGRAGRAEMRFLEGMIDHHQMALDMAADCLERAETEAVVTVCENIISAQSSEIELMQGWLLEWYNIDYSPMSMMDMDMMMGNMDNMSDMHGGHGGHDNMGAMAPFVDPPMMMGMFAGFNQVEGVDYEIAWLESMVDHHDDALHMAERLLTRIAPDHSELAELTEQIIADQTAEIAEMEALIETLSGS